MCVCICLCSDPRALWFGDAQGRNQRGDARLGHHMPFLCVSHCRFSSNATICVFAFIFFISLSLISYNSNHNSKSQGLTRGSFPLFRSPCTLVRRRSRTPSTRRCATGSPTSPPPTTSSAAPSARTPSPPSYATSRCAIYTERSASISIRQRDLYIYIYISCINRKYGASIVSLYLLSL